MKSAYRAASISKHPDQNLSPDAFKEFEAFQEAYAILEDQDKRLRYELYGDWNQGAALQDGLHSATFYLAWLGVLYYLSYVEEFRGAGKWLHFLLIAVACFEIQCKAQQLAVMSATALTINQQVELVKDLLPTAMLLCYIFHFSTTSPAPVVSEYEPEPALKEAVNKLGEVYQFFGAEFINKKINELVVFNKQIKLMQKEEKNNIGGMGGKYGKVINIALTIGILYAVNSIEIVYTGSMQTKVCCTFIG